MMKIFQEAEVNKRNRVYEAARKFVEMGRKDLSGDSLKHWQDTMENLYLDLVNECQS